MGLAIRDAIAEGHSRGSRKSNPVYRTSANAGKEGYNGLAGHREVYGDGIALFHTEIVKGIGHAQHRTKEVGVGDPAALTWFVCFVDNRSLKKIRRGEMLENHSPCWHAQWSTQLENAVGRCVRGALWEPDGIASLETVCSDGFKWGKGVDRIQYGWSCRVLQCCQWRTFTQVEGGNCAKKGDMGAFTHGRWVLHSPGASTERVCGCRRICGGCCSWFLHSCCGCGCQPLLIWL